MDEISGVGSEHAEDNSERIVTHWKRFACGLWRLSQGDISAAYCADTFPKLKTFVHEGHLYANCGCLFSTAMHSFVTAYPLIPPEEYHGPERVKYSYEGEEGTYKNQRWRLGPKVIFESSDLTVKEWTSILRIFYADGGFFATGVTYHEFLTERLSPKSPNERTAHVTELALCEAGGMPETQEAMKVFLGDSDGPVSQIQPQLELSF